MLLLFRTTIVRASVFRALCRDAAKLTLCPLTDCDDSRIKPGLMEEYQVSGHMVVLKRASGLRQVIKNEPNRAIKMSSVTVAKHLDNDQSCGCESRNRDGHFDS